MKKFFFMFLISVSAIFADLNEKLLSAVDDNNVLESRLLIKMGGSV